MVVVAVVMVMVVMMLMLMAMAMVMVMVQTCNVDGQLERFVTDDSARLRRKRKVMWEWLAHHDPPPVSSSRG